MNDSFIWIIVTNLTWNQKILVSKILSILFSSDTFTAWEQISTLPSATSIDEARSILVLVQVPSRNFMHQTRAAPRWHSSSFHERGKRKRTDRMSERTVYYRTRGRRCSCTNHAKDDAASPASRVSSSVASPRACWMS